MILILRWETDGEARRVAEELTRRGAAFLWFDPREYPARSELSLRCSAGGRLECVLHVRDQTYDLSRVTVGWHFMRATPNWGFTATTPTSHPEITDPAMRAAVLRESRFFMEDVWRTLPCRWVPGTVDQLQHAEHKITQLRCAADLGFELPPTLITNSRAELLRFHREHRGEIISKAFQRALLEYGEEAERDYYFAGTEPVSPRDLGHAGAVRYMPTVFQAYVPKRVELRVTVVGQQLFTAEIDSQRTNHTRHDLRRFDTAATPYRRHLLPADVEQRCLRLLERLGLCYGSLDLILTPDGRYVFLEINPGGRYDWIERRTGLPITPAVCDLLMDAEHAKNV